MGHIYQQSREFLSCRDRLRIKRIYFIRMSGDIEKHNFLGLGGQANRLRSLLADGVTIDKNGAYLALQDRWE